MRYLITGYSGQLGYDVYNELIKRGINIDDILVPTSSEMNLTNEESVMDVVNSFKPNIIFNCAAWTNVDGAEDEEEKCMAVNVTGAKNIVNAASMIDAKVIYISSDYVFDGTKDGVYYEDDITNPLNIYGKSKALGEQINMSYEKSFVVRTSWVFGINGKNFIKTMLRLGAERDSLSVVCDQIGSPTYTVDLAKVLVDLANTNEYGIYHATNENYCSWNEFAKYIFEKSNMNVEVSEILTKDYVQKAKRPLNSRLSKDKLSSIGLEKLPSWQDAVDRYLLELKKER